MPVGIAFPAASIKTRLEPTVIGRISDKAIFACQLHHDIIERCTLPPRRHQSPDWPLMIEGRCVHELIAATAAATPDAIALTAGGRQVTYRELNARANQLARILRANGVGPEVLVGLSLRRTPEMVVGMLGILKAGGAYVPLDPSYPTERLSFMIQDSRAKIVVTTADLAKTGPATDARVVRLDADWSCIEKGNRENFDSGVRFQNLAYVIYTSGSTGKPKGVMVTHAGLANYLLWAMKEYGPDARRSALVHTSISFDLTITGLFTPLTLGGRVELLAEDAGIDGLSAVLRGSTKYGLVKITPAHLDLLRYQLRPDQIADKVGVFVIGGENLTAENLRFWREYSPSTRLINEYGPTETVVGCCTYEVGTSDPYVGSVPIGRPIDNTQLYVLDEEMRTLPAGTAGELYIGGAGVARGYLNLPELTRQRFLTDQFSRQPYARIYRTGDLVRRRETGIFEYLGRLDEDQVKLRGYRIELGEVEAAIAAHPAIHQSATMVQTENSGHKQLIGYAVRRENHVVSQAQLREFLIQKLPKYMVPSSIVFLDALPLTLNGKVDRAALPATKKQPSDYCGRIVAPQDEIESKLAEIFQRTFDLSSISTSVSFFDLGGDSLQMVELLVAIEKIFGNHISMATLFGSPSITELARVVRGQKSTPPEVISLQPAGFLPPFFCFGAGPRYQPLATHLGTERPFLSLLPNTQAAKFMQLPSPYTIDSIAAYSARIVTEYQREGPYYLGGWSASGVVAYEIARHLRATGHEVGLLVLFDVKNSAHSPQPFSGEWFKAQHRKVNFLIEELKQIQLRHGHKYVDEKVTELKRKLRSARIRRNGGGPNELEGLVLAAIDNYRPQPYAGRATFFRAASRASGDAWDFSRGWHDLITGGFEVHEVPGDHRSMFSEPNVAHLGALLRKMLDHDASGRGMHPHVGPPGRATAAVSDSDHRDCASCD
jgi:amino acid adenylation domain-containing protein